MKIVTGNLLDQNVDVIVNPWNRNFIPWWLLLPQGVSGKIKRKAGLQPFQELSRKGLLSLGSAVLTSAGKLPFKGIIHVAGLNLFWRATESSISESVNNAVKIALEQKYQSIAFPLIGSGTGGFSKKRALNIIKNQADRFNDELLILIVLYDE